jgi:poly-gamma-glutamate capsule biosynthesis protein CapA/YwtB (metallophosphatase superfamily)
MKCKLLFGCMLPLALALSSCANAMNNSPTSTPQVSTATPTSIIQTSSPLSFPTNTNVPIPTPTFTPEPGSPVTLEAVGDIMLGRTIGEKVLVQGPQVVFAGVKSVLDQADVLVGNLECVLTDSNQAVSKTYNMKAPPEAAQSLSMGGFDLVSLANNHAMDFGYPGLLDSQKYLSQYGILTVGAGGDATAAHTPVIIEKNGLKMAFLAYVNVPVERSGFDTRSWEATQNSPGIAWADPEQIKADVIAAKAKADVVIVLLHSGLEVGDYLPPLSDVQRQAAHNAIDAGASVVLGSHPHVLEQIELYHGGLIAYSLGNFVFDQYYGIADATVIFRVVLDHNGFESYDYVPVLIENGLPQIIPENQVPAIGTRIAPLGP